MYIHTCVLIHIYIYIYTHTVDRRGSSRVVGGYMVCARGGAVGAAHLATREPAAKSVEYYHFIVSIIIVIIIMFIISVVLLLLLLSISITIMMMIIIIIIIMVIITYHRYTNANGVLRSPRAWTLLRSPTSGSTRPSASPPRSYH